MYLDQMNLKSIQEALEVYVLAHKYLMESARKACVQYILSNLRDETTVAVLEISVDYKDEVLNKKCKEMLNRNPDAVMLSEGASYLSKEMLRDLLKDDAMKFSSEVVPFKGVIAWGKAQLDQQGKEPSGSALREKVEDLLKEVRFLDMSCDEFVDNVVGTDVLSHTECIHILRAIRRADPSTVPESTLLNPNKGMRLRGIRDLPYCDLSFFSEGREEYSPSSQVILIENLVSNKNICVHYSMLPSAGIISILDNESEVVSTAASEDGLFTFTSPAALKKDRKYRVVFITKKSISLRYGKEGSTSVGNVSVSCSSGRGCILHFCESSR